MPCQYSTGLLSHALCGTTSEVNPEVKSDAESNNFLARAFQWENMIPVLSDLTMLTITLQVEVIVGLDLEGSE